MATTTLARLSQAEGDSPAGLGLDLGGLAAEESRLGVPSWGIEGPGVDLTSGSQQTETDPANCMRPDSCTGGGAGVFGQPVESLVKSSPLS